MTMLEAAVVLLPEKIASVNKRPEKSAFKHSSSGMRGNNWPPIRFIPIAMAIQRQPGKLLPILVSAIYH